MDIRWTLLLLVLVVLFGCAGSYTAPPCPTADAGPQPCEPGFVDEGDACVAWRAIPPPFCEAVGLVRRDAEVAIHCSDGNDYALGAAYEWRPRSGPATPIEPVSGMLPDGSFGATLMVAVFPDGERIATHGDVYAWPAAWRAGADGTWRDTIPPPSAFLSFGAALSDDEALFVGRDAFVFVRHRRAP